MTDTTPTPAEDSEPLTTPPEPVLARIRARHIVLIGMMGAGKSAIGRRLGKVLAMPFLDSDTEIEKAAGMKIPDIFETQGEAYFRAGEARVMARILEGPPCVLATGGGAWMNPETRARVARHGVSIWLKADVETLIRRVRRRSNRPLLRTADPEGTLRRLLGERAPVYAEADITIASRDVLHGVIVQETLNALARWHDARPDETGTTA